MPYTLNKEKNDYYPESNLSDSGCRIVHEADSSYIDIEEWYDPFFLSGVKPSFQGDSPDAFSFWLANRIVSSLDNDTQYDFRVTIDFIISDDGRITNAEINPVLSDDYLTSIHNRILEYVKASPRWEPERHYWKNYYSPFQIQITARSFNKEKGTVFINQFDDYYYRLLTDWLWEWGPRAAQSTKILANQIASDSELDSVAYLKDIDLNDWIKKNIQDLTEFIGFDDSRTTIELIISSYGWVAEANVIDSDDTLLGEYLAGALIQKCPRWTPATIDGKSVPSRVIVEYHWHF